MTTQNPIPDKEPLEQDDVQETAPAQSQTTTPEEYFEDDYSPQYNLDDTFDEEEEEQAEQAYVEEQTSPYDPEDDDADDDDPESERENLFRPPETPDLTQRRSSLPSRPLLIGAAVILIAVLAATGYYLMSKSEENKVTRAERTTETSVLKSQQTTLSSDVSTNRDAINEIVKQISNLNRENARNSLELSNMSSGLQQIQLPKMAQTLIQMHEKTNQLELEIQRLEEENNLIKQAQSSTFGMEQQIKELEERVETAEQNVSDYATVIENTKITAVGNAQLLRAINATPPPTDPVVLLAICMDKSLAKPPQLSGTQSLNYTEHITNVFREKIEAGEITLEGIHIRLAQCRLTESER